MKMETANTRCVKLTIFVALISCASNVGAHFVGPILLLWTGNTILSTSLAQLARPFLERKTVTTSITERSTATTTTPPNLLSAAMAVRQRY